MNQDSRFQLIDLVFYIPLFFCVSIVSYGILYGTLGILGVSPSPTILGCISAVVGTGILIWVNSMEIQDWEKKNLQSEKKAIDKQ